MTEKLKSTIKTKFVSTVQSPNVVLPPTLPPYSMYISKTISIPYIHVTSNKPSVIKTSPRSTKVVEDISTKQSITNKSVPTEKQAPSTNTKIRPLLTTITPSTSQYITDNLDNIEYLYSNSKLVTTIPTSPTKDELYFSTVENDKTKQSIDIVKLSTAISSSLTSTKSDEYFSKCNEKGLFDCKTSINDCIDKSLVCDGYNDCTNGNDEQNCSEFYLSKETVYVEISNK